MKTGKQNPYARFAALSAAVLILMSAAASGAQKSPLSLAAKLMQIGQKKVAVKVLEADLTDDRVTIEVGLAYDSVGAMEDLSSLAGRKRAAAAINGTYFDAYSDGPVVNPVGTIITGGRLVHKGGTGTVIGFGKGNVVKMDPVRFKVAGGTNGSFGWPNSWYAHHINRASTAEDSAILYTPEWGREVGGDGGSTIVVAEGKVAAITTEAVGVPPGGFALHLRGSEKALLKRFKIGVGAEWKAVDASGAELKGFWADVSEAIGAGPRLVDDGRAAFNISSAIGEGFTEAKVLSQSLQRSAVGVTASGKLLLVTTDPLSMSELAALMLTLGAKDAMSLDGGASSGLWYDGEYATKPGREIPNAILIYRRD